MSKSLNFAVSIKLDKRSVNANGKHPIKLRVWNRASKRVKMYSCNKFSDVSTFEKAMDHKSTVKGDTYVLRTYLERVLSNALGVLDNNTVKSFDDFEKFMFGRTKQSANLYYYIDRKVNECKRQEQFSSRDIYKGLRKLLESFSEGNSFEVSNLSVKWFESLEAWYLSRKKNNGDSYKISGYSIYARHLRIIINELVDENLISQKDYPFGKNRYTIPSAENNKRPLATEDIQMLLNYSSDCPYKNYAVDFWKLSYYWMGINLRDVIKLQWNNIHDDKIYYYRSKTFKRSKINQHLKKVARELGISSDISTIWSRHSFATEMKRKKVSPYVIQEAFGHKDIKTTENYMSSLVEDDLRDVQKML